MIPEGVIQAISEAVDETLDAGSARSVGGGCVNECHLIPAAAGNNRFFVKLNRADRLPMFEAEAEGLAEIAAAGAIRVPRPICHGVSGRHAYLALEGIDLRPNAGAEAQGKMGAQLAALHRATSPNGKFGWRRDNTIGETPQRNPWTESWIEFFAEHRLGFQFDLAARNGRKFTGSRALREERLPALFRDYSPAPSLLHGDLWGGNAAFTAEGEPVLFDPATYFGDRETDLAFTEMFGGFGPDFYATYDRSYPIDPGYARRKPLYNLYHLLNHFNLFGGGYARQAQTTIERLLADRP